LNPSHASSGPHKAPLFRPHEGGVDEALGQVEFAPVAQVLRQRVQDLREDAGTAPLLEAAMTGRRGGVAVRHILPRGTRAQHPQDAVEHGPIVAPGAAAPIGANLRLRNQRRENGPLFVLEIHGSLLGAIHDAVREQLTPSAGL
jgi:hypothetical protein